MSSFEWNLLKERGLEPESTLERPLDLWASATVNVAETATIKIPNDKFIHAISIMMSKGTVASARGGTAVDNINEIRCVCDGNKYYKKMRGGMAKEWMKKENCRAGSTGFYTIFFTGKNIPEAWPLPAWLYTSISLQLDLAAGGATYYNSIDVTLFESDYKQQDLASAKILIQSYATREAYGTGTGEKKYEHDRAYKIYSYIYECDDNLTLADDKFDYLIIHAFTKESRILVIDKKRMKQIKEDNTNQMIVAPATGYYHQDFPIGLPAYRYTNLRSILNIPTAGTDIGVKVMETYVL